MIGRKDSLGVEIEVGDTVTVIAYGWKTRLADTGRRFTVIGRTHLGNLTHDTDVANGHAVRPECVAVARRDGQFGHEGNRVRCTTCGDPLDAPTGAGSTAVCANLHHPAKER